MSLNRAERERVSDSRLKIQSVAASLHKIDPAKIPNLEEIQECLDDAEETLKGALASPKAKL
jgi:hypothetical protein